MRFQTIKMSRPKEAIGLEPLVQLFEWFGADAIEATLRIGANIDQTGVSEDSKML
jgi:hypothetical protein